MRARLSPLLGLLWLTCLGFFPAVASGEARPAAAPEALPAAEGYDLVADLMSESRRERRRAAARLIEAGDRSLVAGIVDALFFIPRPSRAAALEALEALTGAGVGERYWDWVEYLGGREDLQPKEGYLDFKAALLARIDPGYRTILYPAAPSRVRLEEVVWGGVRIDGIPSLDFPAHVPAAEATYLSDDERVFGVSVGGSHRAYPVSVLSWHEMLNDEVGGRPVTLSYCTLCGSGILYDAERPDGGRYTFGTSGLLYRSNKLMFDRETRSLWTNLTGEPVVGRLAGRRPRLTVLPMTLTTWEAWRRMHPDTTALAMDRDLRRTAIRHGFRYRPGAAEQARRGVSFPVWQRSDRLADREEVYTLRVGGRAKAYPLEKVLAEGIVHDELGGTALVLLADRQSGAVRAYERGARTFVRGESPDELVDDTGSTWTLTESALLRRPGPREASRPEPARLSRLPGHVAFWFGWFGFHPDTEVYD